jgi:uncharacterized protein (DUF2147 family)
MKYFLFIFFFLVLNPITSDMYLGKWRLTGGSIIEIYRNEDIFEGRVIQRSVFPLYNRDGLDGKNPKPTLRKRAIVGLIILNDLYFKEGELLGGSIYNSDTGKTYKVQLLIDENNTDVCHVEIFNDNEKKDFKIKRVLD